MQNAKILLLEDSKYDVELIEYELSNSGFDFNLKSVSNKEGFIQSLQNFFPDIILADYNLPAYDGLEALDYCISSYPDTPFIFVTGALGEERAVETLRKGAKDFILKSQLPKLPQIIQRALDEASEIKQRKMAERALQKSEEQLKNLMRISPTGIFQCDQQANCTYVNDRWCEITGLQYEEALGLGWSNVVHPDDKAKVFKEWYNFTKNKVFFYLEFRFLLKNGRTVWVISTGHEEKNAKGETVGYIGNITDITKLKKTESELKAKNQSLRKVNKELDGFVYSASHDLRAPLSSMLGLLNLLKLENGIEERALLISKMEGSIHILEGYIKDVVSHTKNTRLEIKQDSIDFELLIKDIFHELKYLYNDIKIEKNIKISQKNPFFTDYFRLNLILRNIISNAIKYRKQEDNSPYIEINVTVINSKAHIIISDHGEGIGKEHLPKIFDMFYRANETKSGSGLGLYMTKEAVEKLGGQISASSELGKNTTFKIELPNLKKTT